MHRHTEVFTLLRQEHPNKRFPPIFWPFRRCEGNNSALKKDKKWRDRARGCRRGGSTGGNVQKGDSGLLGFLVRATRKPLHSERDLLAMPLGSPCSENPQNQEKGKFPNRGAGRWWPKDRLGLVSRRVSPSCSGSCWRWAQTRGGGGVPRPGVVAGVFLCLSASWIWNAGIWGSQWPSCLGFFPQEVFVNVWGLPGKSMSHGFWADTVRL